MPNIGPLEIIILLVIVLVIFGPKRLPELGRGLGKGMREFKDSVTGKDNDDDQKALGASNTVQTTGQATAPPEQAAPAQQQPPPAPATAPAPPPEGEQAAEPEAARSGESRG
jgi:sec-independent protein translocase protein TatA